jgi:hypothetical protein
MKLSSKAEKIRYVNDLYNDIYTEEQAVDELEYLTAKRRWKRTTKAHIRNAYQRHEIGHLLYRLDPELFSTIISDFNNR